VTESVRSRQFEGSIMLQSQSLSSIIPFVAIERPACPKCQARMLLARIAPVRLGVDLHTFECEVCDHVLETLTACEDPMQSKIVGRWIQGDLHSPK
jgi:hypothetical protein